jgi:8-oxo-dGTP pyrophosphatase MutT (NUDIX family)
MWLITPIGFFSIVQKPGDVAADTLTIRSRVRSDLEALRQHHLPHLGAITESKTHDYRFRAVAPRAEVAQAMAEMVKQLNYSNFKSHVAKTQGNPRSHLYHKVWDLLCDLQTEPSRYSTAAPASPHAAANNIPVFHPKPDEHGQKVTIKQPSQPSALSAWSDPLAIACVTPNGPMPKSINGLRLHAWEDRPKRPADWEALAARYAVIEPDFKVPSGYKMAAGVVVRESDGRIWVVAPSNAFAGYKATFPKGTLEGLSAQATALLEAFEESGLHVRLLCHLVDVKRSQSYTRYYLAERIGGHPADMGWESQAVLLVPEPSLPQVLNSANDLPIIEALQQA